MGDRPVTAMWGIGGRTAAAARRRSASAPSSELAAADHDELARRFGPTIGPYLRVLGLGGDDAPVVDEPWVAKLAAARRRRSRRDLAGRRRHRRRRRPPGPEVTAEVVADGRRVTHVAVKVRTATFFTRTKIAKLPDGPTTDPDVVAAVAAVVLDRFELRGRSACSVSASCSSHQRERPAQPARTPATRDASALAPDGDRPPPGR